MNLYQNGSKQKTLFAEKFHIYFYSKLSSFNKEVKSVFMYTVDLVNDVKILSDCNITTLKTAEYEERGG